MLDFAWIIGAYGLWLMQVGAWLSMLVKQWRFGWRSGVDDAVALLILLVKRAGAVCLLERAFVDA